MKKANPLLILILLAFPLIAAAQIPEDAAKASAELAARQAEAIARAQQKVAEEQQRAARAFEERLKALTPLDVEVVLSRYQGDQRVSSLPFQLSVNATHPDAMPRETRLRMGAQVPLPTQAQPTVDGKPIPGMLQANPVQYKEIGTSIDAYARDLGDGSFEVVVTVSETSVYTPPQREAAVMGLPVLRTYMASNNLIFKSGQTKQFTLAADRISGETLKVDVTVRLSK